ncbi:hypothetical protein DEU56DRAFT_911865 [Suillus clintonianus]|uniref:uncharacterized protein n=1 Tax=Suillus clintonianus TaxID=1904413 RepID=UPI001B85DBDC|nr:uncharacterized protein DEU56DRAFT_911865 [Suillus clintonianus]KAG2140162.1 hypothetical protein DEU56DRAFT_911865 [Suillus clintonianus]
MAVRKQSKTATEQSRETRKARMRAQLENVSVADTADNMELDEPGAGRPARAAKTAALTRADRPMKHKRVRKEPANMEEPTSTVQAPASLPKAKRKHANSVVEVRKALNTSKVQPSEALHQREVKKVKLTPKLSRTYPAPNPLQVSSNKRGNPKVKDGTAESDLGDFDEDGEDRDEQDSLVDAEDEDEEFADLTVENFGDEGVQWTQKSTTNQVDAALDDESEDDVYWQHKSKITTREKKLQDEMPHFADDTEQKPLTVLAVNSGASDTASLNGTTGVWLTDTDLQVTVRGNVPFISIKLQSEKVCKVVRGSYERGQRMFAFGLEDDVDLTIDNVFAMTTAFATRGTETLAYEALVESADHEGYTGDNDMAERLLSDSWAQYAKPLIDYTTRRIHLCRNQFKKAVGVVVTSVLNLATNSAAQNSSLLEDINYIYPWSAKKNKYETSKPFQAEVIKEGVRAGFFVANQYNDLGIKFSYLLSSSLSTAPDELEVVNHMIASVATAVEACILDFNVGKTSEFVGPSHDNTFKAHMLLLLTMKQKKPLEYHKLTHGIYRAVVGMRSIGSARLSKEQIIAQVDWDNMGGESD